MSAWKGIATSKAAKSEGPQFDCMIPYFAGPVSEVSVSKLETSHCSQSGSLFRGESRRFDARHLPVPLAIRKPEWSPDFKQLK